MRTNARTRLTWFLSILLTLAAIAGSVSYVVSAHQAQDAVHGLRQIALITGPDIPPRGLWAFDIGFVDDQSQVYYLADASNASVDMVDTRTNTLIGQIGGFRGFHGSRETQGPGGVLVVISLGLREPLPAPTVPSLLAIGFLIVFGSLIAFSAYGYLLRNVRPALATSYAYVNPMVAVGLGILLDGEHITLLGLLAMLAIIAGVCLVSFAREARR